MLLEGVSPKSWNLRDIVVGGAEALGRTVGSISDTMALNYIGTAANSIIRGVSLARGQNCAEGLSKSIGASVGLLDAVQIAGDIHYVASGECAADAKRYDGATRIMGRTAFFVSNIAASVLFLKDLGIKALENVFTPLVTSVVGYVSAGATGLGYLLGVANAVQNLADKRLMPADHQKEFKIKASLDLVAAVAGVAACVATVVITALSVASGIGVPVLLAIGGVAAALGVAKYAYGTYYEYVAAQKVEPKLPEKKNGVISSIQDTTAAVNALTEKSEGVKNVAKLGSAIIDTIDVAIEPTEEMAPAHALNDTFKRFSGVMGAISIFQRVKEWVVPEGNGKRFWQQKGSELKVCNRILLTGANALEAVTFLGNNGLVDLGAPAAAKVGGLNGLELGKSCAVFAASMFSIADSSRHIHSKNHELKAAQEKLNNWRAVVLKQQNGEVVALGAPKTSAKKDGRARSDEHLQAIDLLYKNGDNRKSYVEYKIAKWEARAINSNIDRGKNIFAIVNEIFKSIFIALKSVGKGVGLMGIFPFTATLLGAGIATAVVGVSKTIYDAVSVKHKRAVLNANEYRLAAAAA